MRNVWWRCVVKLPPELRHLLAQTELFTDGKTYVIVKIGAAQVEYIAQEPGNWPEPFWACMQDKDEVSLVLTQEASARSLSVSPLDVSPPYRLITFDLPLDWNVVGYLAALTAVLAEAGISLYALSAFSRDHLFVPQVDFDRAWDVLSAFLHTCREQVADLENHGESV
jgi:hypothetical protein